MITFLFTVFLRGGNDRNCAGQQKRRGGGDRSLASSTLTQQGASHQIIHFLATSRETSFLLMY